MPTYDYKCEACGHKFEKFEPMTSSSSGKECPACGKKSGQRVISGGGGILFKGNGFYCTDYKKKEARTEPAKPESKDKA
jgi:putative FmdB family regulatory protein